MSTGLWEGMRIPIVMVSGAVNSGKTLFALNIDPNCRKPAADVKPTTLLYDQEGSADSYQYEGAMNYEHKDTRAAVAAGVHRQQIAPEPTDPRWLQILKQKADVNDSPSASMFRAWYLSLIKVPAGRYTVGICDTFTPLQEGLIDWLRRHPEAFGRTVNEYTKASSMFLWPDVKNMLAHILTVDCRLRFETFMLTLHLKNEWAGGRKTGRQIAEGLDVLEKLATVHIELDRTPKIKGKDAPRVPCGILKKERLVRFGATADDDQPILPPRLPQATPNAIRKYIASPPDFAKLSVAERLPDDSLSDDQKLLIQQDVARNNVEAETAKLSALELARAAIARPESPVQPPPPIPQQPQHVIPQAQSQPPQQSPAPSPETEIHRKEMMDVLRKLFATGTEAHQWLVKNCGVDNPAQMPAANIDSVLSKLYTMLAAKNMPPEPAITQPEEKAGTITPGQRHLIRERTTRLYGDKAPDAQTAWLKTLGFSAAQSCTYVQAEARILELQRLAGTNPTGADNPF